MLGDGTVIEAKVFRVPESKDHPRGIKYSFQHYDPEAETTLLRYDNYARHSGSRHHKHLGGDETRPTEFESLSAHFKKFMEEIEKHA